MQITMFLDRHDKQPVGRSISLHALATMLTVHTARQEKDGPLWCPCQWKPGRIREKDNLKKGNLLSVCCFVADIDDGTPPSVLFERWVNIRGEPLHFILYSSYSSTQDEPRYRVAFPLSSPIPAEQWEDAWKRCSFYLTDNHNDSATKDPTRIFYLPACPAEAMEDAFVDERQGVALSPWEFAPLPEPEKPKYENRKGESGDGRPGDLFNEQASPQDVKAILERAGYRETSSSGDEISMVRPGKPGNVRSLVIGYIAPNVAWNYSDNAYPLQARKAYDPFELLALLEFGGDWKAAAKSLVDRGFKSERKPFPKMGIDSTVEKLSPLPEDSNVERSVASSDVIFPCTDLGNAERLVHHHGPNLRYNGAFEWMVWNGKQWVVDDTGEVYRLMEHTIRSIPLEASELVRKAASLPADDDRREGLNKKAQFMLQWAFKSESAPRIKAGVDLAQHQPGIYASPEIFDADPFILNVQNGMIDLRSGLLLPHDKEKLCIKICPVNYDPMALCPLWTKCLQRWQPLGEVRDFLQRAAGYTLTGHTGEETAFLLHGDGRNGKSKFTAALEYILGDYAGRAPIDIFMEKRQGASEGPSPDKANMVGKRLIVASEIMKARRLDEAFVKDSTGGDKITAAHKFKKPFEFKPQLKLWLYGNHKPIITGADDGIKSRLPLIPFAVKIPVEERDLDLDAKLRAEAEGILAWAVRGCLEWQKNRLSPPAAVIQASDAYHEEMDMLARFFKECLVFGPDGDGNEFWSPASDIRQALLNWGSGEAIDEKSLPKPNEVGDRLRKLGCDNNGNKTKRLGGKPQKAWSNVRVRTEKDDLEAQKDEKCNPLSQGVTEGLHPFPSQCNPVTPVTSQTRNPPMRDDIEKDASYGVTAGYGVTLDTPTVNSEAEDLEDPFGDDEYGFLEMSTDF